MGRRGRSVLHVLSCGFEVERWRLGMFVRATQRRCLGYGNLRVNRVDCIVGIEYRLPSTFAA
jgi:hypothetical protein